jgi:Carboxypeptidase activation peptide
MIQIYNFRYQVFQTKLLSKQDVAKLVPLTNDADFDFWSRPRPMQSSEIMVGPSDAMRLKKLLEHLGLDPTVLIVDVST